jgi:hypothetical protein
VRARLVLSLAALALSAASAKASPVERDDPRARLRALREWYGTDVAPRSGLVLDAARRERDRYAIGARRPALVQPFARVANSAFLSIGPTDADFEVNGDTYLEVDSGRARQILPHPLDPDVLYLSTSGGGVWKTYNARSDRIRWEPITDGLGTTSVGTLAMDPSNPDILFLGFGDPFDVQTPGITRSTDGGGTWRDPQALIAHFPSTDLTAGTVTDVKVDPRNSLVVLATTDVGLFRSTDGGGAWSHVPLGSSQSNFYFMWSLAYAGNDVWLAAGQAQDLANPPSAGGGRSLGLWRSTDDGATWTWATTGLPQGDPTAELAGRATLASAPSTLEDPATARVYLLMANAEGSGQLDLMRSDDGGVTFQSLQVNASAAPGNPNPNQPNLDIGNGQAWYNQALLVDPSNPDTVFIGGQFSIVRSTDAGRSWWIVTNWLPHNSENAGINRPYVHADVHAFAVGADRTLYVGSDGGIGVSADALSGAVEAVSFTSKRNEGLVSHLVYSVACAPETWPPSARSFVAGGMQDNGTRVRVGEGTKFNQLLGGDGVGVAVSGNTHDQGGTQVPDVLIASVAGAVFQSRDGGQEFTQLTAGLPSLPFLVRVVRDVSAGDIFLTFSASPAGFYRWRSGELKWTNVSGTLHWLDSGKDTRGFVTVDNAAPIALRNLAAHPRATGTWAAVSNRFTYMTTNNGARWQVGRQAKPAGSGPGVFLLSSVEFDWSDASGNSYYVTTVAPGLVDDKGNITPYPASFGRVLRTTDGGASWTSLGVQGAPGAPGRLPDAGVNVIKVDPNDPATLYVGTELGLYRSTDSGQTWFRFGGGSLPLVEVRDFCISPSSQRLTVATFGRGFWQIDTGGPSPAGVRGVGDTNFDSRIDGEDLIDLADAFNATQSSPVYRWQADLVGSTNLVDDADLSALLAKFGGAP